MKEHEVEQRHRTKAARNRDATGDMKLICECSDLRCNATLAATPAEYANRSRGAHGFWVRPGHQSTVFEHVVEENDDYAVVQMLARAPAPVVSTRYTALR
jgi:hypothetical protein